MAKNPLHQGQYYPKFPEKYLGDKTKIVYRSSWERKCMVHFDLSPNILAWNSEDVIIPYISPKDGRVHRYFVDFLIVTLDENKQKQVTLIEVKPLAQTIKPIAKQGKSKKRFLHEAITYEVNTAKWKAAQAYCDKRGWQFRIMTEKDIF